MHAAAATTVPFTWRHAGVLRAPLRLAFCLLASAIVIVASVGGGIGTHLYRQHQEPLFVPAVSPRPVLATFYDLTPTEVTVTRNWLKFTVSVPRYQFLSEPTLWRQMHFEDWDRLELGARHEGLTRLLAHHGHVIGDPQLWRQMTAAEWDDVPQPVRAMAIVGMIEHWVGYYQVGAAYGLDPTLVLRTAKAIAMSESWFDHRAVHVNADGTADYGVGGASRFARETLRRWHERGRAQFTLADEEYFNPWLASRWLAFWLALSLDEAGGDLALATRAYNVGIGRAIRGAGQDYLSGVERRRSRFFEGPSDSPTWSALSQYRRDRLWLPRLVVRPPLPARPSWAACAGGRGSACLLPMAPPLDAPEL